MIDFLIRPSGSAAGISAVPVNRSLLVASSVALVVAFYQIASVALASDGPSGPTVAPSSLSLPMESIALASPAPLTQPPEPAGSTTADSVNSDGAPSAPGQVKVGLYITQLYDLDIAKKSFNVAFWAWYLHTDSTYKPLETVELVNSKQSTTRYASVTDVDGIHWSQAKYYATVAKDWDIRNYPFDRQALDIYLEDGNSDASTQALIADVSNSRINESVHIPGWTVEGFSIREQESIYNTSFGDPRLTDGQSTYSRIVATITLKRNGLRILSSVFVGFFVAFFMSTLTYFLDFKHMAGARISLCAGGIFASAGNKFAVDNILVPGGDFTLADGIEISTFVAILCAIAAVVALRPIAEDHPKITKALNALIGLTVVGGYLAFNGYNVFQAVP